LDNKETQENKAAIPITFRKVLVPVDGSENSMRAAEVGIKLARDSGAELVVLSVVAVPSSIIASDSILTKLEKDVDSWVGNVKQSADKQGVKIRKEVIRSSSSVVQAITEHAQLEGADIIVIGTRGLGSFKRLILGSVSEGVVRHAPCDVLVVR
jgi:nucleotide-binding universal stress UspA family protein